MINRGAIELEMYCDELGEEFLHYDNTHWMYIGALFVPLQIKPILLEKLLNLRCLKYNSWIWNENECANKCGYHNQNNTEIHYSELHRSKIRYYIASRWLNDFLIKENNKKDLGLVYFHILGINLTNLEFNLFGPKKGRGLVIYNRFFRSVIKAAEYFFPEHKKGIIKNIYHDKGSQESHDYFPWHPGYRINIEEDSKLSVENEEIIFIDSDHRIYPNEEGDFKEESQFIQFIDLILGSVYCCLHDPAESKYKRDIGLIMKPLLSRLLKQPKNKNSNYHYFRKQSVSFFPKGKKENIIKKPIQIDIFGDSIKKNKIENNLYTNRPILLQSDKQTHLEDFF